MRTEQPEDFTRYLPEIYQNQPADSFFMRFVRLFQEVYLELERKIDNFPDSHLNIKNVDADLLPVLAGWLAFDEFYLLPKSDGIQRKILEICTSYYKKLGTRAGFAFILERLAGKNQAGISSYAIVEFFQYKQYLDNQKELEKHYGASPFCFTILLRNSPERLPLLLEYMKPTFAECNIIELQDEIILDGHTYLGVNSFLPKSQAETGEGESSDE